MDSIYILVRPDIWELAQKTHQFFERTLANEGFIHACHWHQLDRVANAYFQDTQDLVIVEIDPAKVQPPIRWEESASTGEVYPHIYGILNISATTEVQRIHRSNLQERFEIPAQASVLQR